MRLFFAVDLPEEMKGRIIEVSRQLAGFGLKFVEKENLHLTLKFLGEVDKTKLEEIVKQATDALADVKRFEISVENMGYFGGQKHPSVVWLGIGKGKGEIVAIEKILNQKFSYIRKEDFEPSPHITIGRLKYSSDPNKLLEKIRRFSGANLGDFVLKEIKLEESKIGERGPVYSDVEVFKL